MPIAGSVERAGRQCYSLGHRSLQGVSLGGQGCPSRPDLQEVSKSCQGHGILHPRKGLSGIFWKRETEKGTVELDPDIYRWGWGGDHYQSISY